MAYTKQSLALSVGFISVVAASGLSFHTAPPVGAGWTDAGTADTRLVIAVDDESSIEATVGEVELAVGTSVSVVSELSDGVVVQFDQPVEQAAFGEVITTIESLDGIEFVEPDSRRWISDAPDDALYTSQWSLNSVYGADPVEGIDVEAAWTVTPGSNVGVVAVIDTGIQPHPDIISRLTSGADLITSPNVSNDGDGRDSDNTDPGDACGGVTSSWHGLHVAGTIGATSNNGLGIAGVDQRARVLPVRAIGTCGGWASDVADAIRWAAGLPVPGVPLNPTPAKVVNLSLGGAGMCSLIEQSAIDAAVGAGTVVVAAAGNSASDLDAIPFSPASCNNVIAARGHDQVRRSRRLLELRVDRRHRRSGRTRAHLRLRTHRVVVERRHHDGRPVPGGMDLLLEAGHEHGCSACLGCDLVDARGQPRALTRADRTDPEADSSHLLTLATRCRLHLLE